MTAWIGPLGAMQPIRAPQRGLGAPKTRPSNVITNMSGRQTLQRAPRTSRTYPAVWPWLTADEAALLREVEAGIYGPGPNYFYDRYVARTNMLDPAASVPGLGGDWSQVIAAGLSFVHPVAGLTLPDGRVIATGVNIYGRAMLGTRDGAPVTIPVLPGQAYALFAAFACTADTDVTFTFEWHNQIDGVMSTDTTTVTADGTTQTDAGNAIAPTGAAGVRVSVTGVGDFTAFMLVEVDHTTTGDGGERVWSAPGSVWSAPGSVWSGGGGSTTFADPPRWTVGEGIPRVAIAGLDEAYQILVDGGYRSSGASLVEVA